ncbi:unnamed protein product [Closterium sp. NIES-53]
MLSRKKQREAPESNVKVCKASAGPVPGRNRHAERQSHRYQSHRLHCRHSHLPPPPPPEPALPLTVPLPPPPPILTPPPLRCHLHHRRCHLHHPGHPYPCCCGASH